MRKKLQTMREQVMLRIEAYASLWNASRHQERPSTYVLS